MPSASNATPVTLSPKVDYATQLFRMLCVDDSTENDSSSSDTNTWVDFDCTLLPLGLFFFIFSFLRSEISGHPLTNAWVDFKYTHFLPLLFVFFLFSF